MLLPLLFILFWSGTRYFLRLTTIWMYTPLPCLHMDSPHLDSGDLMLRRSGFSFAITNVLKYAISNKTVHIGQMMQITSPHLICLESPSPRNFGFEYLQTLKSLVQSSSQPPECLIFFLPSKIPQTRSISGVYLWSIHVVYLSGLWPWLFLSPEPNLVSDHKTKNSPIF